MGSFDGAETCELVGSYLLSKLAPEYGKDIGLYRDDGLAAFNKTPRETENIKKHIYKVFSDHNLKLTIEANKKCINYLNITLDLRSASYKPFMKPGNTPQYVNCTKVTTHHQYYTINTASHKQQSIQHIIG
jgi:hypothetical protein